MQTFPTLPTMPWADYESIGLISARRTRVCTAQSRYQNFAGGLVLLKDGAQEFTFTIGQQIQGVRIGFSQKDLEAEQLKLETLQYYEPDRNYFIERFKSDLLSNRDFLQILSNLAGISALSLRLFGPDEYGLPVIGRVLLEPIPKTGFVDLSKFL